MGRTWDEQFKVDSGHLAYDNLTSGKFDADHWMYLMEHPMVGKYVYGFFMGPHLIRMDDGQGHYANLSPLDIESITNGSYMLTQIGDKLYMVSYDLTTPRLVSALLNSLAVVVTVMLAMLFLANFWSFIAGLFLIFTPRFVAMGQLITFESLTLFLFVSTIYIFYKLLNEPQKLKYHIATGILCGLLFWTRYNNYFIFIFLGGWMFIDYYFKRNREIFNPKLFLIPVIAFFLGIIIWPLLWNDFPKYLIESFMFHKNRIIPSFYYLIRLVVTTPIPILVGLVLGIFYAVKEKKYWQFFFLFWFTFTLVWHMVLGIQGGGTRYIFIIYPAVVILCAYGYSKILKKKWLYALIAIFAFMIIEMFSYYPYYLDYYNLLIGGIKGASKLNYEISWWGEGQRDVGIYANKIIPEGSSFGYFVVPRYVAPPTRRDIKNFGFIDDNSEKPDYVMVSRWRMSDFENRYKGQYEIIYSEKVRGEDLVVLLKKKK